MLPIQIKKVLVLYVGGTIGMEKNSEGAYAPSPNKFFAKIRDHPQLHSTELAKEYVQNIQTNQLVLPQIFENQLVLYTFIEYQPLLDSSNMSLPEWIKIGKDIETNYNGYEGFVILQGTDTLAYTSSALSFMLDCLQKPVIITGSQISIFEARTDSVTNIVNSLIVAGCHNIPEVCVLFANKLMRGNRTTKISNLKLEAFDSPNFHTLAEFGVELTLHKSFVLTPRDAPFKVHTNYNMDVGMIDIFPTFTASMLRNFLQKSLKGLVLKTYGLGNIPSNQTELIQILAQAVERGVLIVNITHCQSGTVRSSYQTGKILEDIGIVPGNDMTGEAALCKLCYILGLPNLSFEERAQLMRKNIRGELTSEIDDK